MGAKGQNYYNALVARYGYEREAREIQELYLGGKKMEAIAAVPDALVDEVALVGDARPDRRPARGVEGVAGDHPPDPGPRPGDAADDGRVGAVKPAELFDLSGRTAIVTGGGSGIGRQMATGLAEAGADVVLCARKPERCEEAAAELERELGVRALGLRCDVRDPAEVQAVVDRTRAELGSVDILVNNAGTSWGAAAEDHPLEGWQKVIDVNLTGVFLFAQAAGRVMIEQGGGKIVNIASVAAFGGAPPELMNAVAYNASKGGVVVASPATSRPSGRSTGST